MGHDDEPEFKKLGMIGVGRMGAMMSLLYAEHGVEVHYYDPSQENVHLLQQRAKDIGAENKIIHQQNYKDLSDSIAAADSPKLFVFSIPHGSAGDDTVQGLRPYLEKGDIILDCSNEYWRNTERRQESLEPEEIHYIGCGVSGGYQSARHGPSMSPGGDADTLKKIIPFLQRVAAKDKQGRACTTPIGPRGSGHYVKQIHNGIEQGMMSAVAEMWFIMNRCLKMKYEAIGDVFETWDKDAAGMLRDNFLLSIGADINRTKNSEGNHVLADVLDKVVQDVDNSEGTGVWTCEEAIRLHVPAPTIVSAHLFRLASADAARRTSVNKAFSKDGRGPIVQPGPIKLEVPHERAMPSFLEDLKLSLYAAFLCAFVQGLRVIQTMDQEQGWNLDLRKILQIWRGGCIIQSDGISDLLDGALSRSVQGSSSTSSAKGEEVVHADVDLLSDPTIASELSMCMPSLKNVVLKSLDADAYIPSLSATFEFLKYSSSTELPTQFMEAQLDYFGGHNYELKSEGPGKPVKGPHHYEWKPAKGIFDTQQAQTADSGGAAKK